VLVSFAAAVANKCNSLQMDAPWQQPGNFSIKPQFLDFGGSESEFG
jgi:hypothetical protein